MITDVHTEAYALLIIAKKMKPTQKSFRRQTDKQIGNTYTIEYYLGLKRNEVLIYVTTWMNLEKDFVKQKQVIRKKNQNK